MNQSISPANQAALPETWTERLFQLMEDSYGSLWVDRYAGIDRQRVKRTWSAQLAGYTGAEIKRGIDAVMRSKFPPTLPEFLVACRPPIDPKADWIEACEQMRIRLQGLGEDRWSRPEVYWAAVKIGSYDLNTLAWDAVKTRWQAALENAKSDPVPEYLAQLPKPGETAIKSEDGMKRIAQISADIGRMKPDPKLWARKIIENPTGCLDISVRFAKLALANEAAA